MNNEYYKHYQLMEHFVTVYDYTAFYIHGLKKDNEIWIINKNNPNYQIIRISNDALLSDDNNNRINTYLNITKQKLKLVDPKFLDLRISKDIVVENNKYDIECMDVDYHDGVDLTNIFPDIYKVLHNVDDQELEIKRLTDIINAKFSKVVKTKKRSIFIRNLLSKDTLISKICIIVSSILFVFTSVLSNKYSHSASIIFLGADYKMFTLGLNEYWRLFTGAFLHGSFIHLFCNCLSLYTIGSILEPILGKGKYSLILICGIIGSSLTHGVLSGNSITIGLSGGIYALLAYLLCELAKTSKQIIISLFPTLLFNLAINFLPNVSWQSHLGGAIVGLLFFYILEDGNIKLAQLPIIFILFIGLFYKYYSDHMIKPYYGLTDMEVLEIADNFKFDNYVNKTSAKLYKIYVSDRGE